MSPRYKNLESLTAAHELKRAAIRKRLAEFRAVKPQQYFYELAYCCMTPQSSAINAAKAQQALMMHDFERQDIDPEPLLHQKDYYIRFHITKAKLLLAMKSNYSMIHSIIMNGMRGTEKREWLVKNVRGLGLKEATHFLRNIGMNEGMAILDRHILKNLRKYNVIRSLPRTLTKKKYLSIERSFQKFANEIGIPIDELDLVFWSNEAGEILK